MEKQRWEEPRRRREEERRSGAPKGRKSRFTLMICGSRRSKRGSLKRRVRSHVVRWAMKNYIVVVRSKFGSKKAKNTPVVLEVKMSKSARHCGARHVSKPKAKNTTCSDHFSWDVEKVHAVVAPSTLPSKRFEKLTGSELSLTFKCRFAWQAQGIVNLVKSEQDLKFL